MSPAQVLLSELLGFEAHTSTNTHLDVRWPNQPAGFWQTPSSEWAVPLELGVYGAKYPTTYARRERTLRRHGISERLLMAPPWLFSAESDAKDDSSSR